ncbi:MAG TPA: MOSC domain-containing protein [Halanaerobiales bacterium]|nr:MOSC domain-containing protein [Halanaerobiales bacterium]
MEGKVLAICRSTKRGTTKEEIKEGEFEIGYGLKGDAHGGDWHRQISLLGKESVDKMQAEIDDFELNFGDFAENITTEGLLLYEIPIGTKLKVGEEVVLEVTQIGKKCHQDCEIFKKIGKCVMPKEGIFARVIKGGKAKTGDEIEMISLERKRS